MRPRLRLGLMAEQGQIWHDTGAGFTSLPEWVYLAVSGFPDALFLELS